MLSYRAMLDRMFDNIQDFANSSSNLSKTDFLRAAQAGQLQNLQTTWNNLSNTARKDYLDGFDTSAYSLILEDGHLDVAQWLFDRFSIEQRNYSFFERRQTEAERPTFMTFSKLMEVGKFEAAKWFYNHSPNVHKAPLLLLGGGYNALYYAAHFNDEDMVEWVLQECDPAKHAELLSANGNTAFKYCSRSGNLSLVKRLHNLVTDLLDENAILSSLRDIFYYAIDKKTPAPNTVAIWSWYAEEVFKSNLTAIKEVVRNYDFEIFKRALQLNSLDCANWLYNVIDDGDRKQMDAIAQQHGFEIDDKKVVMSVQHESAQSLGTCMK